MQCPEPPSRRGLRRASAGRAVPVEVMRTLSPRLQELLGYDISPPFLGYVDGRHPRRVLGGSG